MICAFMSLLYGCVYIIRFGTMRKTYKAAEWVKEAQKSRTAIFRNVWVLLAMPAAWLAWSMVLYIICIMSFVWRTGTTNDASQGPVTDGQVFPARVIVSGVLLLGLVYLVLITATLRQYGDMMDRAWRDRISRWIQGFLAEHRHALSNPATERLEKLSSMTATSSGPAEGGIWETDVSKVWWRRKLRKPRNKHFMSSRASARNAFARKDTTIASTRIRCQTDGLQNINDDHVSLVDIEQTQMHMGVQEPSHPERLFELHGFDENREILMLGIPGASIAVSSREERWPRTGRSSPDRRITQSDYAKPIKMFRLVSLQFHNESTSVVRVN